MEPVTMAILYAGYFLSKGGWSAITKWWDDNKKVSDKDKKKIEDTKVQIQNDFTKMISISTKMKKNGDGYEILQNSIGF
jgi:hypothetical protein